MTSEGTFEDGRRAGLHEAAEIVRKRRSVVSNRIRELRKQKRRFHADFLIVARRNLDITYASIQATLKT